MSDNLNITLDEEEELYEDEENEDIVENNEDMDEEIKMENPKKKGLIRRGAGLAFRGTKGVMKLPFKAAKVPFAAGFGIVGILFRMVRKIVSAVLKLFARLTFKGPFSLFNLVKYMLVGFLVMNLPILSRLKYLLMDAQLRKKIISTLLFGGSAAGETIGPDLLTMKPGDILAKLIKKEDRKKGKAVEIK